MENSRVTESIEKKERLRQSEIDFRKIIEHSTNLFYTHDTDHVLTYLSPQIMDILGYKPEEAMIRWTELVTDHPVNIKGIETTQRAIETGETQPPYELQLKHKSGDLVWVEAREAPVVEDGKTVAITGSLTVITDQKQAQNKLRESEIRFRNIFQNAGDAIGVVDGDDNILDVNPKMCELLGYSREQLLSMTVVDLQAPENRGVPGQIIRSEFERFGNNVFEVLDMRSDGVRVPIELRLSRVKSDRGDLYYCIYRDISHRKKSERERQAAFDTLTTILESINAHIYVADMESFEILYMNKNMQDAFGEDFTGKICYEVFRNETFSCPHCSNEKLLDERGNPTGVQIWETQNPITESWYVNHARAIQWHDGRMVRIQIALDITERKKTEQLQKERADEIAALHAITLDITSTVELQSVLESIVAKATDLLSGLSGGLYLCDNQKREVRCVVSFNTKNDHTGTVLEFGEGAAGQVAETGEPLVIDDYRTWEGRAEVFQEEEAFQAILSVPISWQDQIEGVLHVLRNSDDARFEQTDLELLMTLANNAAIGIQNFRLLQQIQNHADELEEAVEDRTSELQILVNSMAGREVRMAELKGVIKRLRKQLIVAGLKPVADDPLNEPID